MGTKEIGEKLKKKRKETGLSVKEITDKLKDYGCDFSVKTIYGWENGHTQPDADSLLALCDIYEVDDILKEFGTRKQVSNKITLSDKEAKLIKCLREISETNQGLVYDLVFDMYEDRDIEFNTDEYKEKEAN